MQTIRLLSGAYDNGGAFKPAGEGLDVGDESSQISEARATDMVDAGYAEDASPELEKPAKGKAGAADA